MNVHMNPPNPEMRHLALLEDSYNHDDSDGPPDSPAHSPVMPPSVDQRLLFLDLRYSGPPAYWTRSSATRGTSEASPRSSS
ncbi:hypothetical protein TrST_g11772 [Triparma strigata]|uniref:Uncharacterized protein n=1 Tax=Triparma strigata TaxID=1606541 RepID=A0A9W7B7C8_9STRA|nr:hypothetical protein TrST_g11772 [Triparma strigata]